MDSDSDDEEVFVRRNPFRRPPSRAELLRDWLRKRIPCMRVINPRDDFRYLLDTSPPWPFPSFLSLSMHLHITLVSPNSIDCWVRIELDGIWW
jgi:hypothetical protein